MGHGNIWNSHPKTYGPGSRSCRVCGNSHGIIRKYGLMCCRQCFHSNAKEIGFIKLFKSLAVSTIIVPLCFRLIFNVCISLSFAVPLICTNEGQIELKSLMKDGFKFLLALLMTISIMSLILS
ncbi:40S ribosomal protein S29 [Tanacetum coccineum]|uniref:40S ribosomal protein S29 n=1 Tax=Tanacetum coccineum TaxID=301880 RepID=A0ABQ5IUQ1_9ASTR